MRMRVVILGLLIAALCFAANDRPYLNAAVEAGHWIEKSAIQKDTGTVWPSDPADLKTINTGLYSGTPGPILFYLEAYHDSEDKKFLDKARSGADYLLSVIQSQKQAGLYTGLSGIGYTLLATYKASGDEKYKQGAAQCVKQIEQTAKKAGAGVEWPGGMDIIGGGAGIGLFLLDAARELKDPSAVDTAVQAAKRLVELGKPENGGLKWMLTAERNMPNFSHGTAGITYFLTSVYADTKQKEFLDAALLGAKYLLSIANTEGDKCLIFHADPDGKDRYYLGWCHGPAGTARTFYRLYQVTGDKAWMDWTKRSMKGILDSGIPDKRTEGFWNNVGWCCGSAAVAQFGLEMYQATGDKAYIEFSKRVTADLLKRATRDGDGLKWIQSEHRVKPDLLIAQTGLMQGASGIALWLLHLDEFEHGKTAAIIFPDSPFRGTSKNGRGD
jgi:lantibiotic modifying enzyme